MNVVPYVIGSQMNGGGLPEPPSSLTLCVYFIDKSWRKKSAFSAWSGQLVCYALIKDGGENHERAYRRYIQQGTYHPTGHNLQFGAKSESLNQKIRKTHKSIVSRKASFGRFFLPPPPPPPSKKCRPMPAPTKVDFLKRNKTKSSAY